MPETALPDYQKATIADDGSLVFPQPEPAATPKADDTREPEPDADEGVSDDTGEGEDTDEGAAGDADDAQWLQDIGKRYSYDTSKYKTREDAIAGLIATAKKVGDRDEYAKLGRELVAKYQGREEELAALFRGEIPARPAAAPAGESSFPKTPEEARLVRSQVRTNDAGELVPAPGAPRDAVARYEAYQQELDRRLHILLARAPEVLEKVARFDPEAQVRPQDLAAMEVYRAQQDWVARNGPDLWVDGIQDKGFTPLGQKAAELYPMMGGTELERWDRSLALARQLLPKPLKRPTSQAAKHRPATMPRKAVKGDAEAILDPNITDNEALDIAVRQALAQAGYADEET